MMNQGKHIIRSVNLPIRIIINKDVANCEQCQLSNGVSCPVLSRGNYNHSIMVIGEAPGSEEQKWLLPFVGASGKMLERILNSVGVSSQDLYITNIVKCRPPNNRNPETIERNTCYQWLYEEIMTLKPKLVITLGNVPMRMILNDNKLSISKEHGKIRRTGLISPETISERKKLCSIEHTFDVLTLYHPSLLIRRNTKEPGSPKEQTWNDIQKVKDYLEDIPF